MPKLGKSVTKLLQKFNERIHLSRKKGGKPRSQDLEKILIQTRDNIIINIFLDENSGCKFANSHSSSIITSLQKVFDLICQPSNVSEQSLAVIAALEKFDSEDFSITYQMGIHYLRNILRPEMQANNRQLNFQSYVFDNAEKFVEIINALLNRTSSSIMNSSSTTVTKFKQELCAYSYLINSIVINKYSSNNHTSEILDSIKLVNIELFAKENTAELFNNLHYLQLLKWLKMSGQERIDVIDLSTMQQHLKILMTSQPHISLTPGPRPTSVKLKEKAYFVISGVGARIQNEWNGHNNWDHFPDLGVPIAIGAVPISSLGEHHIILEKCENLWKTPLGIVSSALNDYEHERLLLKGANEHTWSKYNVRFINLSLPDNLKKISPDLFTQITILAQEVTQMWLEDLATEHQKVLFAIWQSEPAQAGKKLQNSTKPRMYLSHCKAGKTRSVTLGLCCLAALYVELHTLSKENSKTPSRHELKTFLEKVVSYMQSIRPQIDMYDSILDDIVSFAQQYKSYEHQLEIKIKKEESLEQHISLPNNFENPLSN